MIVRRSDHGTWRMWILACIAMTTGFAGTAIADVTVTDAANGNIIVNGTFYDGDDIFQLSTEYLNPPVLNSSTSVVVSYDDGVENAGACISYGLILNNIFMTTRDTDHLSVAMGPPLSSGIRLCLSAVVTTGNGPINIATVP